MAKYEDTITGQFDEVVNRLHNDIMNSGLSMELVDQSSYAVQNVKIEIRVYDKYFYRNRSRASLSLTVVGNKNTIFVSAIGAGGGQGIFLNFSLGAETEMVNIVKNSIQKMT
jgi:hypothetical protein